MDHFLLYNWFFWYKLFNVNEWCHKLNICFSLSNRNNLRFFFFFAFVPNLITAKFNLNISPYQHWPFDQIVPVECGPVPGHVLSQLIVRHIPYHSEQILTPHHSLILSGLQQPVRQKVRGFQIFDSLCSVSLLPHRLYFTEYFTWSRPDTSIIIIISCYYNFVI